MLCSGRAAASSERGRFGVFVALNADDVGYQYGVVRGDRAASSVITVQVRQAVLFTGIANRPIMLLAYSFRPAIVHRTVGL